MTVTIKHFFREKKVSLLLCNTRQTEWLSLNFHRNQQKSKVCCTLWCDGSVSDQPSLLGAQGTTGYTSAGRHRGNSETGHRALVTTGSRARGACVGTGVRRSLQRAGWVPAHSPQLLHLPARRVSAVPGWCQRDWRERAGWARRAWE